MKTLSMEMRVKLLSYGYTEQRDGSWVRDIPVEAVMSVLRRIVNGEKKIEGEDESQALVYLRYRRELVERPLNEQDIPRQSLQFVILPNGQHQYRRDGAINNISPKLMKRVLGGDQE